jgi:phosphoglycerate dehydrogenase-like enzyme
LRIVEITFLILLFLLLMKQCVHRLTEIAGESMDVVILFKWTTQIPLLISQEHIRRIGAVCGGAVYHFETEEALLASGVDAELLCTWGMYRPATWCTKARKLRWIFSLSAGVEGVCSPPIGELPVIITSAQGIHGLPMSDTILGFMLAHLRGFPLFFRNQRQHIWNNPLPLDESYGKTVLILGAGKIGTELARRCKAFNMKTIGVGRRAVEREYCDISRSFDNIDDLLPTADFVVLLIPEAPNTRHLIDAAFFSKMNRKAIFINCGRGSVVDETALTQALSDGTIAGAAIDAFEVEPLPQDSPLWDMDNVIITPHCSATSPAYVERAIGVLIQSIEAYLSGAMLPNIVYNGMGKTPVFSDE